MLDTFFKKFSVVTLSITMLLFTPSATTAGNLENLAQSLAKIRGEVEALQEQLDIEKEKHGSQIAALSSQLADLSVEERRQNITIEKLQHSIEKITENSQKAELSGKKLKPILLKTLAIYKRHVQKGFPFKVADRVKAITDLENNIANDLVDPNRAVNQLWSLFEDEIRLSKENGIYQQTITLDEEKILADIAKLGTVFLYFQTKDNRTGMAKKIPGSGWKFFTADSAKDNERIAKLFDSLKKQIRQGYFELPNPWHI
jgi:chromosome segregation ATPase